jgi:TPR repeat protein
MARAYEKGQGVLLSQADSLRWMTRAAQLGDCRAQTKVGLHLLSDRHRPERGTAEAADWFERAAEQGGVEALYQLSVLRLEGRGVRQSDAMALSGFRTLATADHSRAQYYLAWMLANGRGTIANREEALQWAERAAANRHEKALDLARELRRLSYAKAIGASQPR